MRCRKRNRNIWKLVPPAGTGALESAPDTLPRLDENRSAREVMIHIREQVVLAS